jgi:hypothetical protein
MTNIMTYPGSCHCGAVRFEVTCDLSAGAGRCNCTICTKLAMTAVIVKPRELTVLAGADQVGVYEWGGKVSHRHFCKTCGIHAFAYGHLAELGGDYVSVNVNCLDGVEVSEIGVTYWDGRHNNWDAGPRATPWPIGVAA